jgi:hypothetical protein
MTEMEETTLYGLLYIDERKKVEEICSKTFLK